MPKEFRWKTMDGQVLDLPEMATSHIFNSMKMLFNHLALEHGGIPVWFNKIYEDYLRSAKSKAGSREMALLVLVFTLEINRRGDLPEKYVEPYQQILNQIQTLPCLQAAQRQLEGTSYDH